MPAPASLPHPCQLPTQAHRQSQHAASLPRPLCCLQFSHLHVSHSVLFFLMIQHDKMCTKTQASSQLRLVHGTITETQVPRLIWQMTASPTLNHSRLRKWIHPIATLVPWTHMSQPPKRHLDWFSHFCTAHPCAQQTVIQTYTPRNICSNRPHPCIVCWRCSLIMKNNRKLKPVRHRSSSLSPSPRREKEKIVPYYLK